MISLSEVNIFLRAAINISAAAFFFAGFSAFASRRAFRRAEVSPPRFIYHECDFFASQPSCRFSGLFSFRRIAFGIFSPFRRSVCAEVPPRRQLAAVAQFSSFHTLSH